MRGNTDWGSVMGKLQEEKKKSEGGGVTFKKDDRYFAPDIPQGGKYEVVARFLPAPDTLPWIETVRHSFKDDNDVIFNANCPTAIGERCPICESQRKVWADGRADVYRQRKKTSTRYSNILIIEDKQNPENEGKVFIFRYGKQIQSKIAQLIEEEGTPAVVFDYNQGTNLNLKISLKGDFRNYEESAFKRQSTPLTEEMQKSADAQLHDLLPFLDKSKFKSYDELAQEMYDRTGDAPANWVSKSVQAQPKAAPVADPFQPTTSKAAQPKTSVPVAKAFEDEDDDFLARMAEE